MEMEDYFLFPLVWFLLGRDWDWDWDWDWELGLGGTRLEFVKVE
jgi:hypothetical protein